MSLHLFGPATLGRDAEVRSTPEGTAVCNLSLAFNYGRKGADGKKPTQWVEGALWGKLAEALGPYLVKGSRVSVVLEDVHIETFEKNDGTTVAKMAARVTSIDLITTPNAEQQAPAPRAAPAPAQRPPARPAAARPQSAGFGTGFDNMDDDIPF